MGSATVDGVRRGSARRQRADTFTRRRRRRPRRGNRSEIPSRPPTNGDTVHRLMSLPSAAPHDDPADPAVPRWSSSGKTPRRPPATPTNTYRHERLKPLPVGTCQVAPVSMAASTNHALSGRGSRSISLAPPSSTGRNRHLALKSWFPGSRPSESHSSITTSPSAGKRRTTPSGAILQKGKYMPYI